jgi:hypothetical protein
VVRAPEEKGFMSESNGKRSRGTRSGRGTGRLVAPLRVYLAGPLFNLAERRFNVELNRLIKRLGFETYFPQEDAGVLDDLVRQGRDLHQARHYIFERNRDNIETCDVVLFTLDGRVPDEGACIEAGIGYAMGKQVIGLKTDFRSGEPGGNNIMIDGILRYRVAGDLVTLAEMLSEVRDELLRRRGGGKLLVSHPRVARPYVAVVGSIGVGKSTLVRLLGERPDWTLIPEPVEENPYLTGAYADLEGLALRVQAFYLGGRTRQHMRALEISGPAVQDRCLYEDTEVFARTYHELKAFNTTDLMTLENLYEALADLLPRPDLLVYVHAPPGVTLKRIAQRGREFERSIDARLLERLSANYERWIDDQRGAPVVKVDSSAADYAAEPAARREVLARVDLAIGQAMGGRTILGEKPVEARRMSVKQEAAQVESR